MNERERRFCTHEIRLIDPGEGAPPRIVGYAAVFDQLSEELWGFREIIHRGAFAKTIHEADVRALINHDPNLILGRTKSGTLRLFEDDIGLRYEIDPPDTQSARDLMESLRRGDINQSSFAFDPVRVEWSGDVNDVRREIFEVQLYDVSPVTYPAYPQTSAEVRARADEMKRASAPGQAPHPDDNDGEDDGARARLDILRRKTDLSIYQEV